MFNFNLNCNMTNISKITENVVDAVEAAVRSMELDQYFNAGYGAVLTSKGNVGHTFTANRMAWTYQRSSKIF